MITVDIGYGRIDYGALYFGNTLTFNFGNTVTFNYGITLPFIIRKVMVYGNVESRSFLLEKKENKIEEVISFSAALTVMPIRWPRNCRKRKRKESNAKVIKNYCITVPY